MKINAMLLFSLSFLFGCSNNFTKSVVVPPDAGQDIVVEPTENLQRFGDRISIGYIEVLGDYLAVDVSYSGGCEEHQIDLVTNGKFTATYPPEIELAIKHNANQDYCRSMVDEKLYFNLESIRYSGTTRILMRLNNNNRIYEYNY